jgi:hypothetical protein
MGKLLLVLAVSVILGSVSGGTHDPGIRVVLEILIFVIRIILLGFEVFTPAVMKNTVFWDIKRCSPLRLHIRLSPPSSR